MSFEAQIILQTLLLPLVLVGLMAAWARWQFCDLKPWLADLIIVLSFIGAVGSSFYLRSSDDLDWFDPLPRLLFAASGVGIVGWLTSLPKIQPVARWLIRGTSISIACWCVLPSGEGWESAESEHSYWMLLISQITLWIWYFADYLRQNKITNPALWMMGFSFIAAAVVAAGEFATLSEISLATGVCVGGLTLASLVYFRSGSCGESYLGFAAMMLCGVVALSRYYSFMPLPRYAYTCLAAAPMAVGMILLATKCLPSWCSRNQWIVAVVAVVVSLLILAVGLLPALQQEEPEW